MSWFELILGFFVLVLILWVLWHHFALRDVFDADLKHVNALNELLASRRTMQNKLEMLERWIDRLEARMRENRKTVNHVVQSPAPSPKEK